MSDYTKIPSHMRDGARRYIERGIPPGSFLEAVISNDLKGAFGKADDMNRACMFEWVCFFYNEAPTACWGSPEHFAAWIARGGLNGKEAA